MPLWHTRVSKEGPPLRRSARPRPSRRAREDASAPQDGGGRSAMPRRNPPHDARRPSRLGARRMRRAPQGDGQQLLRYGTTHQSRKCHGAIAMRVFIENEAGSRRKNSYDETTLQHIGSTEVSAAYPYPYGFVI